MLKEGQNRFQIQMFSLDQMVLEESEVRLIDVFVDALDLESFEFEIRGEKERGSSSYSMDSLVKLYYYGYLNKTRSSRDLEKLCRCNVEVMWLLKGLQPKYRTIANFRKDNKKSLSLVFKAFVVWLRGEDLLDSEIVAIDGSKIRAQNSKKNNYNAKKVEQQLKYNEEKIEEYLEELDNVDGEEKREELLSKVEKYKKGKKKYEVLKSRLQEIKEQGETQISTTDKDARCLPEKMNITNVSYNVQASVEGKNSFVVASEVMNENDTYALSNMVEKSQEALEKKDLKVLADKGYDTGMELKNSAEMGVLTYVSPKNRDKLNAKTFRKSDFIYEEKEQQYICPNKEILKTNGKWYNKNKGLVSKNYRVQHFKISYKVCSKCPLKEQCISEKTIENRHGRTIERSEYENYIERNKERVEKNKDLYKRRQSIVEHPFGTIKRQWGYNYTLLKGKEKVQGEIDLIFTCYNLRRLISILGVKEIIKRLKSQMLSDFCLFYSMVPDGGSEQLKLMTLRN